MPLDESATLPASNDAAAEWIRQYRTQKRKCDEENGILRNVVKRAKADGINVKSMVAAVAATKLDPDEVLSDLRDTIRYMTIVRIPIVQEALFTGWDIEATQKSRAEDDLWDAEEAGYTTGRAGRPITESPYESGTELDVRFGEYWHKGQASIAKELGEGVKQASASRARPQRRETAAAASTQVDKVSRGGNGHGTRRAARKRAGEGAAALN